MHDAETRHPQASYDVVLDTHGHVVYFSEWADHNGRQPVFADRYELRPRWGGAYEDSGRGFQFLTSSDRFTWLADSLKQEPQLRFYDRKYEMSSITVLLAPDIRRIAGQTPEPSRRPDTLQTWARGRTPVATTQIFGEGTEAPPLLVAHGQKNLWKVRLARNFVESVEKMLLSSASRLPDAKDAAEKQADSTAGAELLKTLGIAGAAAERTDDGLTGLRLGAIADNLPAKYAGLQQGDLLLGVNGWNVNDNRDLGRASRGYAVVPVKYPGLPAAPDHEGPVPANALIALVSRPDSKSQPAGTMLFEIKPPGSPAPPPEPGPRDRPSTKQADQGRVPGGGFSGGRRRRANP